MDNTKNYLMSVQEMRSRLEYMKETLQMIRDRTVNISSRIKDVQVQSTRRFDRLEDDIVRANQLEKQIEDYTEEMYRRQDKIVEQIRVIGNNKYMQLLYKVYIQEKSLRQSAAEMHISYPTANKYHKEGLKAFKTMHGI